MNNKEEWKDLRFGYSKIPESTDEYILMARRIEVAKPWIKNLLKISFYLNILSIGCVLLAMLFGLTNPSPEYYASTPSGKLYKLEVFKK